MRPITYIVLQDLNLVDGTENLLEVVFGENKI
jgi:hypothetical protein